jgi:UDP-glucose 4-epimerase
MSKKIKAVVTGGAGFIGSHLAEELMNRGYSITVIDDLSTGRLENIEWAKKEQDFQFFEASVVDLELLKKVSKGVDYIFHLAAMPGVHRSIETPLLSHEANLTGTLNVLIAAKDNGVKKVIYASSCAVYGDTPTLPQNEDTLPAPQSPYAVTKVAGEYYCRSFTEVCGLPTVCLRYFNVYGLRQSPDSDYAAAIPSFINRVAEDNPPVIFGDGEQTRDFVYVKDVVEANILAANSDTIGIFNIGCGESVTINELADVIMKLMGKLMTPLYQEARAGEIRHSLADISKARTIGFQPGYNLEEGLKETVKALHLIDS